MLGDLAQLGHPLRPGVLGQVGPLGRRAADQHDVVQRGVLALLLARRRHAPLSHDRPALTARWRLPVGNIRAMGTLVHELELPTISEADGDFAARRDKMLAPR